MSSNAIESYLSENLNNRHFGRKNGRIIDKDGYALRSKPEHRYADSKGYVREHRLVWEFYNNAILLPWAVIHHINRNKQDNRIENLQVISNQSKHATNYYDEHRRNVMQKRVCVICGSNKTYTTIVDGYTMIRWRFINGDTSNPICGKCIQRKNILALLKQAKSNS